MTRSPLENQQNRMGMVRRYALPLLPTRHGLRVGVPNGRLFGDDQMMSQENQQTVEALAAIVELIIDRDGRHPPMPSEENPDPEIARASVRDLVAQASRTQEWKQLAEDMGEALGMIEGALRFQEDQEWFDEDIRPLIARLHDLAAEQDAA